MKGEHEKHEEHEKEVREHAWSGKTYF
jgi:hypothetical protein